MSDFLFSLIKLTHINTLNSSIRRFFHIYMHFRLFKWADSYHCTAWIMRTDLREPHIISIKWFHSLNHWILRGLSFYAIASRRLNVIITLPMQYLSLMPFFLPNQNTYTSIKWHSKLNICNKKVSHRKLKHI